jgi:uncharacterized protein YjbI with pentapeptide repeats
MRTPHLLLCFGAALLLAAGADATPITPNTDLSGTVHDGENHTGANGQNSNLTLASLVGTNLTSANLRNVTAVGADFTSATFSGTQLRDGDFTNAIFDGAVLNAQVRDADFSGASFLGADLSAATNWALATWTGAIFDASTILPAGMDPVTEGMILFVNEPQTAALLGLGLLGLGVYGRPRTS